jgi:hypothetical protein
MNGAISPLPQYAFMAWFSVKKAHGNFTFYHHAMKAYGGWKYSSTLS